MAQSKDKIFGFVIMIFGVLMMVFYVFWGPIDLIVENSENGADNWLFGEFLNWQWAIVLPVTFGIICIGLLAAWIGYSMITTPPPVPLEELEEELEAEEAASEMEDKESDKS